MIGELRISAAALQHNAQALRTLITPAKAAFVVKSNAYGHGLLETGRTIEPFAARLCVFSLEEAIALRDDGITAPLLVLGPVPPALLDDALRSDVEIALWDTRSYLRDVGACARNRSMPFSVHVKINTGVNRFGLEPRDALGALETYMRTPQVHVAGTFSHLAAAEEIDSPFTQQQMDVFRTIVADAQPLFAAHGVAPIAHIAASAAAMLWPQTRMDMARLGIACYGLWPSPQTRAAANGSGLHLQPALTFVSELVTVREVAAGAPIGYGCTYHATRATRVGVVPLGYADGIPRALSNTGAFVVDGMRCPIVGRVCMNATLLDLSAAPNAQVGTQVTLIGADGDNTVTADDWAAWAGTINYEIVTRLPAHLPRRFVTA